MTIEADKISIKSNTYTEKPSFGKGFKRNLAVCSPLWSTRLAKIFFRAGQTAEKRMFIDV
jgi:hypothetical protein